MAEFIRYERELRKTLREEARASLGPDATDAEVEALANEEYCGTRAARADREETLEERERREREDAQRMREVEEWGLPEL